MAYEALEFEVRDGVAYLTLNRPKAANALDLTMVRELVAVAERCDGDPSIRALLLTGAGRMFCAGGDLRSFAAAEGSIPALVREVADTQGAARAADLAEGIYLALVTTVEGLIVAIPSLAAFAVFRNRVGIFELIIIDNDIKTMIHRGEDEQTMIKEIRKKSPSILSDGLSRARQGITSLDEVLRVTMYDQ